MRSVGRRQLTRMILAYQLFLSVPRTLDILPERMQYLSPAPPKRKVGGGISVFRSSFTTSADMWKHLRSLVAGRPGGYGRGETMGCGGVEETLTASSAGFMHREPKQKLALPGLLSDSSAAMPPLRTIGAGAGARGSTEEIRRLYA